MATREQIIWADSEYRQRMFWRGFRRKAVALVVARGLRWAHRMDALVMRAAMSRDDYLVYRHKLVIQAELARESGDPANFLEDIYLHEPAKTVEPMMRLARAFAAYREATAKALMAVSRAKK